MTDISKAVIDHLKSSGMDKARLSELASAAATINAAGIKGIRVGSKGIPIPDTLHVSGLADRASIAKLLEQILATKVGVGGIHVFPYGIPDPDIFRIDIDLGAQVGH